MTDKIEVPRELLEALVEILDRADISEGYCCCGDSMQNHPGPMHCGHSPVDVGVYYAGKRRDELKALLSEAKQPAAVDEAAVFRLAVWMAKHDGCDDPHRLIYEGTPPVPWGEAWNRYEYDARAALTAALAAQHQEPTT